MRNSIRRSGVTFTFPGLDRALILNGTTHRIDYAGEFGQDAIAGGVDESAVTLLNLRID
jgi:hypothetical protein